MEKFLEDRKLYENVKKKFRIVTLAHKRDNQSLFALLSLEILYIIFNEISPPNYELQDASKEYDYFIRNFTKTETSKNIPFNHFLRERCISDICFQELLQRKIPHFNSFRYKLKYGKVDLNQTVEGRSLINYILHKNVPKMFLRELIRYGAKINPLEIPDLFYKKVDPEKILKWNNTEGAKLAVEFLSRKIIPFSLFEMIIKFCDVNHIRDGRSLVHQAFLENDHRTVRCLIENGAKVDIPDCFGLTIFEEESYKVFQLIEKKRKIEK